MGWINEKPAQNVAASCRDRLGNLPSRVSECRFVIADLEIRPWGGEAMTVM
ncbi:hypothetical protein [Aminobacter sp. AP02]|uniref:hypothetical protein n=1 Tax=Aminobacter sp. AP02 TaxID=2135737 RepID=UPI001304BD73|nr:hypothetical protein [Aminobacter sp. AP02]